ncbi:hypothetical protein TIFTF001_004657 [Ficus carica]|uniref:Secreted protein n=1 Tax=Ficus carica TaxID=3494 RepID=A0AA87ZVY5_FICCA|nr:hypothetical protein TIFTF001_004657 [Ficus carica]
MIGEVPTEAFFLLSSLAMLRLAAFAVDPTEPSLLAAPCGSHIHLSFHQVALGLHDVITLRSSIFPCYPLSLFC